MTHTHTQHGKIVLSQQCILHVATTDTPGNWNNRKFKTIPLNLSK